MARPKSPSRTRKVGQITAKQIEEAERWLGPMKKPEWRWEAATQLVAAKPADASFIDPDVLAAGEFLRTLTACATDAAREAVQAQWPTISQAKSIFDDESPRRWELEAWLMAGLTDRGIAARCKIPIAVGGDFERLFFARREYLDHREALAQKLFGSFLSLKFDDKEVARFWHYIGLVAPRAVLRDFITAYRAAWEPGTPHLLSVYLRPDAPVSLSTQAFVAAFILPSNAKTVPILFETHLGLIELDREPDPARKKAKFRELQRTMVAFTRGFLDGKSAEELLLLLRYPPSLERVQARMRALGAEGRLAIVAAAAKMKFSHAGRANLPEVADLSLQRESGASKGT